MQCRRGAGGGVFRGAMDCMGCNEMKQFAGYIIYFVAFSMSILAMLSTGW